MNIDFYKYSGIGGRSVNEDSMLCEESCFVVSDGLGGHDNGEIASGAAVSFIADNFVYDLSDDGISRLLTGADKAVRSAGGGGKATLAAVFGDGELFRAANIGDSRVYYFRRGRIFFRTKDHSVCQASVDIGDMTDIDVRRSSDRSGLFKVLGDTDPLKLPKLYDPIDPRDGDAFLICSDGFWENVYETEMEADLLKSENVREWLNHMLKRHLLRSENSGDNFTAICGIIHAPEKPLGKLPDTLELSDGMTVDIPKTMELSDAHKLLDGRKLAVIICAAVVIAASVACVVMLPKLTNDNERDRFGSSVFSDGISLCQPSDTPSSSVQSEHSGQSEQSERPEQSEQSKKPEQSERPWQSEQSEQYEPSGLPELSESDISISLPPISGQI